MSNQLTGEFALDSWARVHLTDDEFELEYQGLYLEDKRRYYNERIERQAIAIDATQQEGGIA